MLNAFFAAIKKAAFTLSGDLGGYTGTGVLATSNQLTAVGNGDFTFLTITNDMGATLNYRIGTGAYTAIVDSTPISLTNGQLFNIRVSDMNTSGIVEVAVYVGGVLYDSFVAEKL